MKRIISIILLGVLWIPYCHAQGVIFYKKDGTTINVPYSKMDSLVTYTAAEPDTETEPETETNILEFEANGIKFKMVKVEGGTFTMGATSSSGTAENAASSTAHQVTLSDYYIGETEVTQALWYAVTGLTPTTSTVSYEKWTDSNGLGDDYPTYCFYYREAQAFINKLNTLTGQSFRMPTEAEWEFAARGGNKSQGYTYSGSNNSDDVGWTSSNSERKFHPVAQLAANELGIYDMTGNVEEFCSDFYGDYPTTAVTNPTGPTSGQEHVTRGGDAKNSADPVYERSCDEVSFRVVNIGMRLAMTK